MARKRYGCGRSPGRPAKSKRLLQPADTFYDTTAGILIDMGVMCEPDSREPWFISAAQDEACLKETLTKFEQAVDLTLDELSDGGDHEAGDKLMPGISG
jgi:glutamate-1-semialdehyde 2,1-aminomutase